jgi:hypothetical protein
MSTTITLKYSKRVTLNFYDMRPKKLIYSAIVLHFIGLTALQAQTTIPASGGNASGSGGTVSYTVGQIVYTKNSGTSGSSAQGVQQPYEISVITGLAEARDISLEIIVYPNPAQDFFKLIIKNYEERNFSYQLFDINGSMLQKDNIDGNENQISMQNLRPSTYILKVIQGNKEIKTFKIIKN